MMMWNLGAEGTKALTLLPETGMGFQLVEATIMGTKTPLLVLNAENAIDLREIELMPGDDPATILRNGLRVIETMKSQPTVTMFSAPQPRDFKLLNSRIGQIPRPVGAAAALGPQVALPSSLVKHVRLAKNRTFH